MDLQNESWDITSQYAESALDHMLDEDIKEDAEIDAEASVELEGADEIANSKEIDDIVSTVVGSGLINDKDIDNIEAGKHKNQNKDQIDVDAQKGEKDKEVKQYADELVESGVLSENEAAELINGSTVKEAIEMDQSLFDDDELTFDENEDVEDDMKDPFDASVTEDIDEDVDDDDSDEDDVFDHDDDDDDNATGNDKQLDASGDNDDVDDSIPKGGSVAAFHDDKDSDVTDSTAADSDSDDMEEAMELFGEDDDDVALEMELNSIKIQNSFEGSGINSKENFKDDFVKGPKTNKDEDLSPEKKDDTLPDSYAKDSFWDDDDDDSIKDMMK